MRQEHSTTPPPHAGHYANHPISIQEHVASLVDSLIEEANLLRVKVSHSPEGSVIVDAGIEVPGGLEAQAPAD
jgi:hypothetical protein